MTPRRGWWSGTCGARHAVCRKKNTPPSAGERSFTASAKPSYRGASLVGSGAGLNGARYAVGKRTPNSKEKGAGFYGFRQAVLRRSLPCREWSGT